MLLFAGRSYYPSGGWDDFVAEYDSLDSVKADSAAWVTTEVLHVQARPTAWEPVLYASTNGSHVPFIGKTWGDGSKVIDGPNERGEWLVEHPAHSYEESSARFDWAHVVSEGKVVAEWHHEYGWSAR